MTLFFLYQPGCAACAAMEPLIAEVEQEMTVLRRNVNHNPTVMDFTPKGTPGFALMDKGEIIKTAVGQMSRKELEQFTDPSYVAPKRKPVKRPQLAVKKKLTAEEKAEENAE